MEKEFSPLESQESGIPSLSSIQKNLGYTRFDLREAISAFRENPMSGIDAPDKVRIGAMEALLIEDIWSNVRAWIEQHPECRGLSDTNVPSLQQIMVAGPVMETNSLPRKSSEVEITPICEETYRCLGEVLTASEQEGRPHAGESYTRDLMQAHLMKWELERKESQSISRGATAIDTLYRQYVTEVSLSDSSYTAFINPATRKMFSGFSFGQSVFWRLPDEAHETLIPKLAHTHLNVIAEISRDTDTFLDTPLTENQNALQGGYLTKLEGRRKDMLLLQKQRHDFHGTSFDPIITGCPAFYTDAFKETGAWIRAIRSDFTKK